ncbi:GNVR domain-containing protein [Acinetobacter sp. VNK23]|uniref:GNVR domain-containing protein n=1 Tax=Acinetobacter thutiue TaxID=2998078 RepID=UPI002577539E|nr:GNVR domain-containing protein [Acinetobacter thutiue]MDM1021937.1 GNVR domain-containing protein [Acinetobacter thutiue]
MNQNTHPIDDTIDPKELLFSVLQQWKIVCVCILLAIISTVFYLKITKDTYSVDAKIQIIDTKQNALASLVPQLASLSSLAGIDIGGGQQTTQTEIEILKSRSILVKTINDLNLDIQVKPVNTLWQKIIQNDKFCIDYQRDMVLISDNNKNFAIKKLEIPKEYFDQNLVLTFHNHRFDLVDEKTGLVLYQGELNKNLIINGWNITIQSKQPLQGKYIVQKQTTFTAVKNMLLALKITEVAKQTGIVNIAYSGTDKAHIMKVLNYILQIYQVQRLETKSAEKEKTLNFLNQQLPKLKGDLEQAERKFNAFRETHGTIDIQQEAGLYLKQSVELETQKIQLEQKQAELAAQYTAQHPAIQAIQAQITMLSNKIGTLDSTLTKLPNKQSQYLEYFREVQVQTQLYTNLLGTYQTLSIAKAGETGNIRILDYPIEPIKPKKLIILILSVFVGGFIGVLIALVRKMLQTGVRNRDEIEQAVGIKTYAELLEIGKKSNASLQSLKTFIPTLAFKLQQRQHNVTLISSIVPDQNQNIIVQHLALYLSQTGKKVLLIDSDLYRGQLDKIFNVTTKTGLSEYLRGQANLDQVIVNKTSPNLSLIGRGQSSDEISISSHQTHIAQLIQQVRAQYDYILLSAAPVLATSDSLTLAQFTGFNLCLVQYGQTQLKDIELAKSYFENAGLEIDGLILDQVPAYQTKQYQYQPN